MEKQKKILLLIEPAREYERGILNGIAKYSHLHGPWIFSRNIPPVSGGTTLSVSQIKKLDLDGIIVREPQITKAITSMSLPVIVSPYRKPFTNIPNILTNDNAIGKMAAEHFLERGFRNFAFFGLNTKFFWSKNRCESFTKHLQIAGHKTHIFKQTSKRTKISLTARQKLIADWLTSLPTPIGIMVANDDYSQQLFEVIETLNLSVPADFAILGVGNDRIVCGFNWPPLSSIVLDTETGGYRAAQLLDRMIKNPNTKKRNIVIEPLHIAVRNSTDVLAIEDTDLAEAFAFIRRNADKTIQVDDVVRATTLSRRLLYKKFQEALGRSIYQEIRRLRMNRAAEILLETNLSIEHIARSLGYGDAKNLSRCFRKEKGLTPLAYRKEHLT